MAVLTEIFTFIPSERAIINICDLLIIYFKPIFLFYLYIGNCRNDAISRNDIFSRK